MYSSHRNRSIYPTSGVVLSESLSLSLSISNIIDKQYLVDVVVSHDYQLDTA